MSKRSAIILTCLLAAVLLTRGHSAGAEDVKPPFPDFTGKVLVANTADRSGSYVEKAQVMKLGDRYFLVGNSVDTDVPNDWSRGKRVWIPVDQITHIVEFDSVEEMKQRLREFGNGAARPELENRSPRPRGGGL